MWKLIFVSFLIKPGFMRGGCLRLDKATHTTRIPTHTTMMVALTGTIMFKSIQSGSPGKLDFVSALFTLPPKGGARVPKRESYL